MSVPHEQTKVNEIYLPTCLKNISEYNMKYWSFLICYIYNFERVSNKPPNFYNLSVWDEEMSND